MACRQLFGGRPCILHLIHEGNPAIGVLGQRWLYQRRTIAP